VSAERAARDENVEAIQDVAMSAPISCAVIGEFGGRAGRRRMRDGRRRVADQAMTP
jgi:hypothetical protein